MSSRRPNLEIILYPLLIAVALILRFLNLGALPLNDFEAGWSLQALQVADGLKPAIGGSPAYVHLSAALFFLFGSSNFMARFWSALAGTVLVLLPLFWRDKLGRLPALLLTGFLGLDPGMLAVSRLAGGPALAIAAVFTTWSFWRRGRRTAAAACAALVLLCGSPAWFGLTGLLLAWGLGRGLLPREKVHTDRPEPIKLTWETLRQPVIAAASVLLLLGTLILLSPKGLSGIFTGLIAFLSGWWTPSGVTILQVLLALPAYELMALAFAVIALVRGIRRKDGAVLGLGIWALAGLLLVVIHPGRQVFDLTWALLPLFLLAAGELSLHFDVEDANPWELAGVFVLMVSILVFAWMDLTTIAGTTMLSTYGQLRLVLFIGAITILVLILVLVSYGWSKRVARLGGVWGVGICLLIFTLAMATGAGGLRRPLTEELWSPAARIGDADLLVKVMNETSRWSQGSIGALPVQISGVDSPALLWALRDWDVTAGTTLSPLQSPALVITPEGVELQLAGSYRGEAFTWRQTPAWQPAEATGWMSWFVHRSMPVTDERIILWVRSDLWIDSQDQTTTP